MLDSLLCWSFLKLLVIFPYQLSPLGFGTTGGKVMQMKKIASFLAHVGVKTSCE
ncbi:hypothetical protein SLEP1_g47547 [Rubroshorea leprosula]|uniref:Uncharacterized protein n=1 Tax=Rubroshorea leprosula TaxID=152421 RepID=A0AAV5LTJ1_9ROSI|nr:hypothetical protein SLEP1_g47547 [Rubroshorea leprosula]